MRIPFVIFVLISFVVTSFAQGPQNERQQFIRVEAPQIALTHVRVIDGTGAVPQEDQTILISDGKIKAVGPLASITLGPEVKMLDLSGYAVLPGLVGMHDHMFF